MESNILQVENFTKFYTGYKGFFQQKSQSLAAVDDVSFELSEGKTLGILGESGCGKTTLARCLSGLTPVDTGTLYYKGQPVNLKQEKERASWREKTQIIFQDSFSSFDPKRTFNFSLKEALQSRSSAGKAQSDAAIKESLRLTGVGDDLLERYPSQLSGGQCQRMSIARTLLLQPEIVICDEPVSALDLTTQIQILNLLKQLQWEKALSYIFISHDLMVINYMSDEVAIMYRGSIVEKGVTIEVLKYPLHPYSQKLLASIPAASPFGEKTASQLTEDYVVSSLYTGCKYFDKCLRHTDLCHKEKPVLGELGVNHFIACHYI
ncbi:MAG: oligopeptide/dipeptide ABC transporter ATP-binding protein [Methanoregula sp.]